MPPTLTASLNPVDDPAFPPAYTPESHALQLSRHLDEASTTGTATPPHSAPRIPYKFFEAQRPTSAQTAWRPDNTKALVSVKQPQTAYSAWSRYKATNVPEPAFGLPDIPTWILGMLAGALSFLFIVAIVLFLAQFPPQLFWMRDLKRRWQGYQRLDTGEYEMSEGVTGGRSSAVAPTTSRLRGLKKRRPTLSIDTGVGVAYDGLGVVVPADYVDDGEWHLTPPTRPSYDEEAFCKQRRSPVHSAWESFTAPLPALPTFGSGSNSDVESTGDLDTDPKLSSRSAPPTIATPDFLAYVSNLDHSDDDSDAYPGSALFRRVNEGIYSAADKLSRAFYDQVNQPEEGLLLPVREGDRERAGVRGVVVD